MNTIEKIVELKNVITEANAIIKQLQLEVPHKDSPFIGPMRSKVTALDEALGAHQVWLANNPAPTTAQSPVIG